MEKEAFSGEREGKKNHLQAQLSLPPEVRLYLCPDLPLAAECRNFLGAAEGPVRRAEKKLHAESWNIQVWMRPGGVPESETSQFVVDSAENFFF